jgi:hypothetical protein
MVNLMTKFAVPLILGLGLLAASLSRADVPAMFIFGDSLTDEGNSYNAGRTGLCPPRFSLGKSIDGPDTTPATQLEGLWEEQLSRLLHLPEPTPSSVGGGNYAVSGTLTGGSATKGFQAEIDNFLQDYPVAPATSIYLIWGGTNDLADAQPADLPLAETDAIANLKSEIGQLAKAGAKTFIWLNVFPIGETPLGVARGDPAAVDVACAQFSTDWSAAIPALEAAYPGITITGVDVHTLLGQIISNPSAYGFVNVTSSPRGLKVDPDTYLFWYTLHPTTAGDKYIAALAYQDFAGQTVTFPPVGPVTFGQRVTLNATASSGQPVTYSVLSGHAGLVGNIAIFDRAGTVVLAANQPGNGTTLAAAPPVIQTVTVARATQHLTPFAVIPGQTYGAPPLTLTLPTASSGQPVTVSVLSGPATLSGAQLTLTGAGAVTLAANQPGNANFSAAPEITTSFVVRKAPQTLTFPAIGNQIVGATLTLKAVSSSGLPVDYTHTEGVAISGQTATMLVPHAVEIRAHQDGNANYLEAPAVVRGFTIGPAK